MVGHDALKARSVLELNYPIQGGQIKEWDDVQELWGFGFNQIKATPKENKLLLTEQVFNTTKNREKMMELAFETYQFSDLQFQI